MPRNHDPNLLRVIGARLQAARQARGLTQAQLAEAIGIEPVTLSRYETGSRGPSITVLARAADALGVRLGDLVDADRDLPEPEHSPEVARAIRVLEGLDEDRLDLLIRVIEEFGRAQR